MTAKSDRIDGNSGWHGWRRGDVTEMPALHVGFLPGRKRPCLYTDHDGHIRPLAYFRTTETAASALRLIDILVCGRERTQT